MVWYGYGCCVKAPRVLADLGTAGNLQEDKVPSAL